MSELKVLQEQTNGDSKKLFGQKFTNRFQKIISTISKKHVEFENLSFTTYKPSINKLREKETILHSISGRFCSGEVSAIIGESGAGKTTLLNILAGYVHSGVTGKITVNKEKVKTSDLKKLSSYILQDTELPRLLSVVEVMNFATELKFGQTIPKDTKIYLVNEIITVLRLTHCTTTWTDQLSGGERKRLSIALGLINNPPVLFLDEPTTGLDITTSKEVTSVMSQLARQGRTIICTIHQPTASIYQQFDHVYVLGRGQCVYQGSHDQLVPFLSSVGFNCPITYNPADYVLECIFGENAPNISLLSKHIDNGSKRIHCKDKDRTENLVGLDKEECLASEISSSYLTQTYLLMYRDFLQQSRDKLHIIIMWIYTLTTSTLLGLAFVGMGNDGKRVFSNYLFLIGLFTYFTFTYISIGVLNLPSQIRSMKIEYFNGWYNLISYYSALMVTYLTYHIIYGPIFLLISYSIADQPLDFERFMWILVFTLAASQVSEAIGHIIGCWFEEKQGVIVCLIVVSLPVTLLFCGFGYDQPYPQFLNSLSFIKLAVTGATLALFENRDILPCEDSPSNYCHYRDTQKFLDDIALGDKTKIEMLINLAVMYVVCRVSMFALLKMRLDLDLHERLKNYITGLFNSLGINVKM